jgi:hypothetical protein
MQDGVHQFNILFVKAALLPQIAPELICAISFEVLPDSARSGLP